MPLPPVAPAFVVRAGNVPMRAAVERFAARALGSFRDMPAERVRDAAMRDVVDAARGLGLLAGSGQGGLLWSATTDDVAPADACHALQVIGACHAGIAFHLHQLALGGFLAERLGVAAPAPAGELVWLPGTHVLAEAPLLGCLAGRDASPGDALQAQLPATGASITWVAADAWQCLWVPGVKRSSGGIGWRRVARDMLADTSSAPLHGLDGVRLRRGTLRDAAAAIEADNGLMTELLAVNALGIIAIALGATRHAQGLARAQADLRMQGGKRIRDHDAVQELLAVQQVAIDTVATLLDSVVAIPRRVDDLSRLFGIRLLAHEQLCRAANAAMQVFGGSGYMQDVGLERVVRDNNQLRAVAGTPEDLKLFIARAGMLS